MIIEFTREQIAEKRKASELAAEIIAPLASQHDEQESISDATLRTIAARGLFGTIVPAEWGGRGLEMISYGLLHEEIGKVCSSTRSLLTVHDMVAFTISAWGSSEQRRKWLPLLARGERFGAFAISEPNVGSDAKAVETTATVARDGYIVNGTKKWITAAQVSDLFLVLCKYENKPLAVLIEKSQPGIHVKPISGLLGLRASMLAEIELTDCFVPKSMCLGRLGFGTNIMLGTGLGIGRYSVAWGCVGVLQGCTEACANYSEKRRQFDRPLNQHELVKRMLARMITDTRAARLLCCQAGYLKNCKNPEEVAATFICKYFSSRAAVRASSDAVQIHGAVGCSGTNAVGRYYRDAKIMEIIEGSNEVQEMIIPGLPSAIFQNPNLSSDRATNSGTEKKLEHVDNC